MAGNIKNQVCNLFENTEIELELFRGQDEFHSTNNADLSLIVIAKPIVFGNKQKTQLDG